MARRLLLNKSDLQVSALPHQVPAAKTKSKNKAKTGWRSNGGTSADVWRKSADTLSRFATKYGIRWTVAKNFTRPLPCYAPGSTKDILYLRFASMIRWTADWAVLKRMLACLNLFTYQYEIFLEFKLILFNWKHRALTMIILRIYIYIIL